MNRLEQIQAAIEAKLKAAGLNCDPATLTVSVPIEDLPAASSYFAAFDDEPRETQTATLLARFRVVVLFSLMDPMAFRVDMLNRIPDFHLLIRQDRSLGGLVDTTTVEDGGPPEEVESAVPIAMKTLWVVAEYEEDE